MSLHRPIRSCTVVSSCIVLMHACHHSSVGKDTQKSTGKSAHVFGSVVSEKLLPICRLDIHLFEGGVAFIVVVVVVVVVV